MKPKTGRKRNNGEGEKPKRLASGNYQSSIMLGGKRVYVTCATAADVQNEIREKRRQFEKGNNTAVLCKYTVKTYLLDWLEYVKVNLSPTTYRGYEGHVRVHLTSTDYKHSIANVPLDKLTAKHVQSLLDEITVNVPSPTTVKNVNGTLKTALSTAIKWELIDRNAAKNATPPKQVKYETHPVTEAEVLKLLNSTANDRYEAALYLGLFQGMRRGEVAAMQWPNIDFTTMTIRVKEGLQRVTGVGAVLRGVKSECSDRTIPMLPLVAEALKRRRERQNMERIVAGKSWRQDLEFVFTSKYGTRIQPEELFIYLKEAMAAAEFAPERTEQIRFHDLRHSTAQLLLKQGVDLKIIQGILGHSSFQITAKFYLQSEQDQMRTALDKLNSAFAVKIQRPPIPVAVNIAVNDKKPMVQ